MISIKNKRKLYSGLILVGAISFATQPATAGSLKRLVRDCLGKVKALGNNAPVAESVKPRTEIDFSRPLQQFASIEGTSDADFAASKKHFPRGSAVMTSSGKLKERGIVAIIHAASGSSAETNNKLNPSLRGVELSVDNSIKLAKAHSVSKIAVPFIGGAIFAQRIGVPKEIIADRIMESALTSSAGHIELVFVAFSTEDAEILSEALSRAQNKVANLTKASVLVGDITDFNLHKAPVIVNAANTELRFGGGVSGAIGKATHDIVTIDMQAQKIREAFEQASINKYSSQVFKIDFNRRPEKFVSAIGTEESQVEAAKMRQFPRGSAVLTTSGKLKDTGILGIIHAASGTMAGSPALDPTLDSVENSVINSIKLAEENHAPSIAFPFIGGAIFAQRIGVPKEAIADRIMESALSAASINLELKFVAFDEYSAETLSAALKRAQAKNDKAVKISVLVGDITDFRVHRAPIIVNAANTELQFGGGVSGAIGNASGRREEIEREAMQIRIAFEKRDKK